MKPHREGNTSTRIRRVLVFAGSMSFLTACELNALNPRPEDPGESGERDGPAPIVDLPTGLPGSEAVAPPPEGTVAPPTYSEDPDRDSPGPVAPGDPDAGAATSTVPVDEDAGRSGDEDAL